MRGDVAQWTEHNWLLRLVYINRYHDHFITVIDYFIIYIIYLQAIYFFS